MQKKVIGVLVLILVLGLGYALLTKTILQPPEPSKPPIEYAVALAEVLTKLPASRYMTNEYLSDVTLEPTTPEREYEIRLGFPWIANDEEAPWYNAHHLGYFKAEGIKVKFVPGGPGTNNAQLLGAGQLEFTIFAGGQGIPSAMASRTPIDIVAVGTFLKGMPLCFITQVPELQGRELTPLDLVGRKVGYQGTSVYIDMLLDKYGIPRESVPTDVVGWDVQAGLIAVELYPGWIMNQPRYLSGNWNALMYRDWVYDEYSDVIAVRRETLETEEGQDMVRRFLRATYRGIRYLLDEPEASARIAVELAEEGSITYDMALARFELQRELIIGNDGLGLMMMSADEWNKVVAINYQYGQIELP